MTAATETRTHDAAKPAKADAPRDPEAADAEKRSAYAEFIDYGATETVITFRGRKFRVPASRADWPTKAMQAFQKRMHADGVELLLGVHQWDVLNQVAPKISDFWEFFPILAEACGFVKQDG